MCPREAFNKVINDILLESVCSFVALIGRVGVKFKEVLGVLNLFRYIEVFTPSRAANSNLWVMQRISITGLLFAIIMLAPSKVDLTSFSFSSSLLMSAASKFPMQCKIKLKMRWRNWKKHGVIKKTNRSCWASPTVATKG